MSLIDREVVRLVGLCASQIMAAIEEASDDIDALSHSFFDTAGYASSAQQSVNRYCVASDKDALLNDFCAIQQAVRDAGTSLQFADRLNQRLSNVSNSLVGLAALLQPIGLPVSATQWSAFIEQVRADYTMEQERQLFDAVFTTLAGASSAERDPDYCDGPEMFENDVHNET